MNPDLAAIQEAYYRVSDGDGNDRWSKKMARRLDRIAKRPNLNHRTQVVLHYAAGRLKAGFFGAALLVLQEEEERLT